MRAKETTLKGKRRKTPEEISDRKDYVYINIFFINIEKTVSRQHRNLNGFNVKYAEND
jgi:hypothetical protein